MKRQLSIGLYAQSRYTDENSKGFDPQVFNNIDQKQNSDLLSKQNQSDDIQCIDFMLNMAKTLLKRVLVFKNMQRQIDKNLQKNLDKIQMSYVELDSIIQSMQQQIKQVKVTINHRIISDKGITYLFYFRLNKQINLYKNAVPRLQNLTKKLKEIYESQDQKNQFCLNQMYKASQKEIIQILISFKNKSQKKLKIRKIEKQDIKKTEKDLIKNYKYQGKQLQKSYSDQTQKQNNRINIKYSQQTDGGITTDLHLQFKNEQNHLDRLILLNQPHLKRLYSCMQICLQLDIYDYYIDTLPPKDNIDFIIKKMHFSNKRQRKQIKQYLTCYMIYKEKVNHFKLKKHSSFIKFSDIQKNNKKSLSAFAKTRSKNSDSFHKTSNLQYVSTYQQKKLRSISNRRYAPKNENSKLRKNTQQTQKLRKNIQISKQNKNPSIQLINKSSLKTMVISRTFSKKQKVNLKASTKLKLKL